jgi:hypothetical protein
MPSFEYVFLRLILNMLDAWPELKQELSTCASSEEAGKIVATFLQRPDAPGKPVLLEQTFALALRQIKPALLGTEVGIACRLLFEPDQTSRSGDDEGLNDWRGNATCALLVRLLEEMHEPHGGLAWSDDLPRRGYPTVADWRKIEALQVGKDYELASLQNTTLEEVANFCDVILEHECSTASSHPYTSRPHRALAGLLFPLLGSATIAGIARRLQIGKRRVRTFIAAKSFPQWSQAQQSSSAIDPYRDTLRRLWDQGYRAPHQLWHHLQAEQGFSGGYMLVYRWVQLQREGDAQALNQSQSQKEATAKSMAPRHLSWSFLRDPSRLEKQEREMLSLLRQEHDVDLAYRLVQQFVSIVKERRAERLSTWLQDCQTSGSTALVNFAQGLEKEGSALHAALTLPYRNGPVEGKINKLKYIKRSMYGRSGFPLLRQKVLKAA